MRDRRASVAAVTDRRFGLCPTLALLAALLLSPAPLPALDSELAPLAASSLLLDITRAGSRLVAVGDRGHVLLSDDEARTWRQVVVPTRAMLTGVSFADAKHGWAVGHDGVILATADGGQTWALQPSGADLETVFLDVYFSSPESGLVAGAYGKCLLTIDGGKSWQPAAPVPDEVHVNQIAPAATNMLYLAGEAGTLLVSTDPGKAWRKCDVPYEGSLFGVLPLDTNTLLAYGLRGNVFVSSDAGATWNARPVPVPVLLMAAVKMKSGAVILAGLGGNFFISRDVATAFRHWQPAEYNGGVSALLEAADGALVVVGEKGAARLAVP
ncbi:MAG TPA: YCF48-related protein [Lacunisphaera sp.]|nr:YCF48-related protein [Lacunisphaera sp.]